MSDPDTTAASLAAVRGVLERRWQATTARLDGSGQQATGLGRELIDRYCEPHRHHHGTGHLRAVLEALDRLAEPEVPSVAVQLAAWFHDAVYQGRSPEDEEASAELAELRLASLGLDDELVTRVADLVRATATHVAGGVAGDDAEVALLLDADLAVLGAEPAEYDAYSAGVRAEHPDVSDEAFRHGRRRVLRALLARRPLYSTTRARELYEDAARANLRRELADLDAGSAGSS